jgi:hypothetical protein
MANLHIHRATMAALVRLSGLVMIAAASPSVGYIIGRAIKAFTLGYGIDFISPWIDQGEERDLYGWAGWFALLALGL